MRASLIKSLLEGYQELELPLWYKQGGRDVREVIIFGPYGQVGVAVIRLCLYLGIKVIAVNHRDTIEFSHPLFSAVDVGDLDKLFACGNKFVVFTGPIGSIHNYKQIIEKTSHLVCFSSTSKFTKNSNDTPWLSGLVAALDKGEDEIMKSASLYGFTVNILRPTLIYGLGLDINIVAIARFIRHYKVFPVYKNGKGLRQPVHVEDLASAVISLFHMEKPQSKNYNLSGGEVLSYRDMVKRIFVTMKQYPIIVNTMFFPQLIELAGKIGANIAVTKDVAINMGKDFTFSFEEAQQDFNYLPRGFLEHGIQDINPLICKEKISS